MQNIVILSNPHSINYDLIHMLRILFPECTIKVAPVSPTQRKDGVPVPNRELGKAAKQNS